MACGDNDDIMNVKMHCWLHHCVDPFCTDEQEGILALTVTKVNAKLIIAFSQQLNLYSV